MSRLTDLLRRAAALDPQLGADLDTEFRVLADRRAFGLNFERHQPEAVELPGRPVRKGDKVRLLPPRGTLEAGDRHLWRVIKVVKDGDDKVATIQRRTNEGTEEAEASTDDLVVVAEFRDPIYPGLVSTGSVERGGDKPFHAVINGENFHALQTLLYTHRGKVDCIYIDPPYNSGAKDWKYNNDYIDSDDSYRHSKWLAMMERRLLLARDLMKPSESVLIVAIDEKEFLRLGLLLEGLFPEANIQMVTTVISAKGVVRVGQFSRVEEYLFVVTFGEVGLTQSNTNMLDGDSEQAGEQENESVEWLGLRRREPSARRAARPNQFYAFFVNTADGSLHSIGDVVGPGVDRSSISAPAGTVALWPLTPSGDERLWGLTPETAREYWAEGFLRVRNWNASRGTASVQYLPGGTVSRIRSGEIVVTGRDADGAVVAERQGARTAAPKRVWHLKSHNAETYGTNLITKMLPGRRFDYPKSLHAVEDVLRFFLASKSDALVLDFFAGSGTTAHAVMRLNREDDGRRQSISVTNNEVAADEHRQLRSQRLRPGDAQWEARGICDYLTKPRIAAAISGLTPEGAPISGDYRFGQTFPMSEGLLENVEFFTLTYNSPAAVGHNRAFASIAPLLWLRAGAVGRRIDAVAADPGWDVADAYGVLVNLDNARAFVKALSSVPEAGIAYIVTDDDRRFQMICRSLPDHVQPVRLYESYFLNFEINTGEAS